MSRRAVPESTAERNRNTLKQLVKLEANKSCSDCKRNKHPRWASWNLGVFICIRCSGIHRGMGTHISRVKSVDLDSWTDEQLQSMLKWGNARANKYWEAKLAPGHMPAESKIENFIRTKYESKRWVMDGEMPDPSTLDVEGDDDVPLSVVQEKAKIERSTSQRAAASSAAAAPRAVRQTPNVDLFGDDPPARPSTGPPTNTAPPPPKAKAAKAVQPADSLLGLDFLSGPPAAPPARPSSNPTVSGNAPSRPDLKQSILSLYASKPAPPPQPQHVSSNSGSFGSAPSPPAQSGFGGMNDAFAGLNFSQPAQQPPKPSPFAGLDSGMKSPRAAPPKPATTSFGGGGSFFDAPTSPPPPQAKPAHTAKQPSFGGLGNFMSSAPAPAKSNPPPAQSNDLFDLMGGSPSPAAAPAPMSPPISQPAATTPSYNNSAFNLSNPAPAPQAAAPAPAAKSPSINLTSNFDAWGSSNAWNDTKPTTSTSTVTASASNDLGGWDSSSTGGFGQSKATPQVSADEDFGDWGHASPVATTTTAPTTTSQPPPSKPAGGFNSNNDDLFSNVWQ